MFSVDHSLNKLDHPLFQRYVKEFTSYDLKSTTYARDNIGPKIYENCMEKIRNKIGDDLFWFGIDETLDFKGVPSFVFVVGTLKEAGGFRIPINFYTKRNKAAITIYQFFQESLKLLFPMLNISDGKLKDLDFE